jgi:apolipoprotein N-acyltransferase
MTHSVWHESFNLLSFFASVVGLYILYNGKQTQDTETDNSDQVLFAMSFAYWIVHVLAVGAQKWISTDLATFTMSLKWLAMISYLLTFSCALSLPLQHISASQQERTDP